MTISEPEFLHLQIAALWWYKETVMDMQGSEERRNLSDRRKKPTPGLSRYTFFGRRQTIRRKEDRLKGGYVDRYSPKLFFLLVLILGLNVLDALFTMMILELSGLEANPVVRSVMALHGERFWIWKFGIVAVSLVMLCLHSKFRRVREIIIGLSAVYLMVILYQIWLILYR
jgi:hypothetical protein